MENENLNAEEELLNEEIVETNEEAQEEVQETEEVKEQEEQKPTKEVKEESIQKRLYREQRKYERELKKLRESEAKKDKIIEALSQGLDVETDDAEELINKANEYYGSNIQFSDYKDARYDESELNILAEAKAEEIMGFGLEVAEEEANELARDFDSLSEKDKRLFNALCTRLEASKRTAKLKEAGIDEEEVNSKEFRDFASSFKNDVDILKVYELYQKTLPPVEEPEPIGDIKDSKSNVLKDFYTREEVEKFTKQDYLDNPSLMEAVENSMSKW